MKHLIYAVLAASLLGLTGGVAGACEQGQSAALKNPALHAAAAPQGYVVAQQSDSDQSGSSDEEKKDEDSK